MKLAVSHFVLLIEKNMGMNRLPLGLIYSLLTAVLLLGFTWVNIAYAAPIAQSQRLGGGVVFNEVLADPSIGGDGGCNQGNPSALGFDTNGNSCVDQRDEFIELYNMSDQAIDIGGWQLWTKGDDNWFTFTVGTQIQPKGYVVVVSNLLGGSVAGIPTNIVFSAGENKILGNNGENVALLNPATNEFIQMKYTGVITPQTTHDPPAPGSGYKDFPTTAVRIAMDDFGTSVSGYSMVRMLPGDTKVITQGQYISPGATPGTYTAVSFQDLGQGALPLPYWLWLGTAVLFTATTTVWWRERRWRAG